MSFLSFSFLQHLFRRSSSSSVLPRSSLPASVLEEDEGSDAGSENGHNGEERDDERTGTKYSVGLSVQPPLSLPMAYRLLQT